MQKQFIVNNINSMGETRINQINRQILKLVVNYVIIDNGPLNN